MKVSIVKKKRKETGKIELLLRYYEKGERKHKSLGITLFDLDFQKLTNEQKRHNKEKTQEAEMICASENEKVRQGKFGIETIQKQRSSFLAFVERVAQDRNTSKGNEGNWLSMIKHLKNFIQHDVTFEQVDVKFLNDFKAFLDKVVQNSGKPLSTNSKVAYYNKLRAALKQAVKEDVITKSPLWFDDIQAKIERQQLVIIDDFGIQPLDAQGRAMLMEIIEDRHGKGSTIITSQVPVNKWYEVIGEQTIADAILDRLIHNAHRLELKGESLRKNLVNNIEN